jgi:hypothetical protein
MILGTVAFVPLPYPTTTADREAALNLALDALLSGASVDSPEGRVPLRERDFAIRNPQHLYYDNSARVSNALFETRGFKSLSTDSERVFEEDGAIISAGFTHHGQKLRHLQFEYVFGNLGAHGYEIRIYKSLLQRRIVFVHAWIS